MINTEKSDPPRLAHFEILRLIGEVDGISLETRGNDLVVSIKVKGRQHELIRKSQDSDIISEHVTRHGISAEMAKAQFLS